MPPSTYAMQGMAILAGAGCCGSTRKVPLTSGILKPAGLCRLPTGNQGQTNDETGTGTAMCWNPWPSGRGDVALFLLDKTDIARLLRVTEKTRPTTVGQP